MSESRRVAELEESIINEIQIETTDTELIQGLCEVNDCLFEGQTKGRVKKIIDCKLID